MTHRQKPGHQEGDDGGELLLVGSAKLLDPVLLQKGEQTLQIAGDGGTVIAVGLGELFAQGLILCGGKEVHHATGSGGRLAGGGKSGHRVRVDAHRGHILLEIDGVLIACHLHTVDLVLGHQTEKITVLDEVGVGLAGHGQEVVDQNGDDQRPEQDGDDTHQVAFVVGAAVALFIGLQDRALLACSK